jgi:hypothetical protein
MKIPALRVEINGELVAVAGDPDASLLTGSVGFGPAGPAERRPTELVFNVIGLALGGARPRQLSWCGDIQLKLGDSVTFQLVEAEELSPPSKALASPSPEELAAAGSAQKRKGIRREK